MEVGLATRFPDVVVLLPGLIGSVLTKDNKPLWDISPGAIWGLSVNNTLDVLEMKGDDPGDDSLGDGVEATALIPNVQLVPGLWKQGGYSILSNGIVDGVGLERGANFFEFPYDWRRDNRVNARKLQRSAHTWLKTWRETSGNDQAKLIILAHSMGGLIARYFIEALEGWKETKLLLSFGTPFRGSGNAVNFLSRGFTWKVGPVSLFEGTKALRSFPSVYQLLPIYPFVQVGAGPLKRIWETELPNISQKRSVAARSFHDEIRDAQAKNAALELYRSSGPKVHAVVGTEQPTYQSATLDSNMELSMLMTYDGQDYAGDGTVPRVSAIPLEFTDEIALFLPNSHSALQSDDGAIAHARGVLTGAQIDLQRFRLGASLAAIGLKIDDLNLRSQPVTIEAKISEYVKTAQATVTRLDGSDEPRVQTLRWDGEVHKATITLPAGLYKAKVEAAGARTVEDVFLVVDA